MNNKCIAITAVLVAVTMLAGIVATTPITTVYAQESEAEYKIKCKGSNNVSGFSFAENIFSCNIVG